MKNGYMAICMLLAAIFPGLVHLLEKADSVVVSSGKTSCYAGRKDKFSCTVTGGNPPPTVIKIYFKRSGGKPVEITQGQDRVMVKEDNQAEYYCEARVPGYPALDVRSKSKIYNVTFRFRDAFLKIPPAHVGQVIKVTCGNDESNPITSIEWYLHPRSAPTQTIKTGLSSSDRKGMYGGIIRVSEWSLTVTKALDLAHINCISRYFGNGRRYGHSIVGMLYVTWSTIELKMGDKTGHPITAGIAGVVVTLKCETDSGNFGSPGTISWYRNGLQITNGQQITTGVTNSNMSVSDKGTELITFTARKKDNLAKYECEINRNQASLRRAINITVHFPPNGIRLSKTNVTIKEGDCKTIYCSTMSSSNPAVIGYSVMKRLGSSEMDMRESSGYPWIYPSWKMTDGAYYGKDASIDFRIDTTRKDNGALYTCSFKYMQTGTTFKETVTVNVQFNPSNITMLESPLEVVHEGRPITFVCETDSANPVADVQFHRKRTVGTWEELTSGITLEDRPGEYNGMIRKSTFAVTASWLDNQAVFRCEVNNPHESFQVNQTTIVNVYHKAKWNPELPELFTVGSKTDSPLKFVLHVMANPPPTSFTWFFPNMTAIGEDFQATKVNETTYTLSKQSVGVNDYGNYIVTVTNAVGISTFTFVLQRVGPPYPPCCLQLVSATALSLTMTFTSNFDGGTPQTFATEKRTSGGNVWETVVKGIADPGRGNIVNQAMSGLNSDTGYEFRVKATNADGSAYGGILEAETKAAPNVKLIVDREDNQVTVSWPKLLKEYTKIQIKFCLEKGGRCDSRDVADPTSLKSSFTVKEGYTYNYFMMIFEEDQVFVSAAGRVVAPSPLTAIGGVVGGFMLLLIIAAVLATVFILKKRRADEVRLATGGDAVVLTGTRQTPDPVYMNVDNRAFESDAVPQTQHEPVYVNYPQNLPMQGDGADLAEPQNDEPHQDQPGDRQEQVRDAEEGAPVEVEHPYEELNITPDVIADQAYTRLKPWQFSRADL